MGLVYQRYLRVRDVVEVMRAVSDIRDLHRDRATQRDHLLHTALTLLDARQGFSVIFKDFTPRGVCTPDEVFGKAVAPDILEDFLKAWSTLPPMDNRIDPLIDIASQSNRYEFVQLTGRTLPYEVFTGSRLYEEFVGPLGIQSVMTSNFDLSPAGTVLGTRAFGLSIHRMTDQKPFNERELARLELLNHELNRLARLGQLRGAETLQVFLTKRQREIGRLLLRGLGAKQIARELDLSTHTVYTYCKDLYRRLSVADRMEAVRTLHEDPTLLQNPSETPLRVERAEPSPDPTSV